MTESQRRRKVSSFSIPTDFASIYQQFKDLILLDATLLEELKTSSLIYNRPYHLRSIAIRKMIREYVNLHQQRVRRQLNARNSA